MHFLLFIFLQPDPGQWGDPDALPVDQYTGWLFIAALLLGIYSFIGKRDLVQKSQKNR